MSEQRCVQFMADLEKRDLQLVKNWFADEAVLWMPPTPPIQGVKRIAAMFKIIFRMYTEIHWKVTDVWPVTSTRFVYLTDSWGIIGKQTPYENHIMSVIDFDASDRIVYLSDYFKDTAIFQAEKSG